MPRHALSIQDSGKRLVVSPGDEIVIELAEKATSGYEWATRDVPDGVDARIERPAVSPGSAAGADAPTRVVVTVRKAVSGRLVLEHRQPWDASSAGATSFEIELASG